MYLGVEAVGPIAEVRFHPLWLRGPALRPWIEGATTAVNIIRGDWLRRLPRWEEFGLFCISAVVLGFLPTRRRLLTRILPAAGWGVAVPVVALWLVPRTYVWFPYLIVVYYQIPLYAIWIVAGAVRRRVVSSSTKAY